MFRTLMVDSWKSTVVEECAGSAICKGLNVVCATHAIASLSYPNGSSALLVARRFKRWGDDGEQINQMLQGGGR